MNDTEQTEEDGGLVLPPGKLFFTIGEVAKMLGEAVSAVRYWEKEFEQIKPRRNAKGNRLFSPQDVRLLAKIRHLLKDNGMTMEGVKKRLAMESPADDREAEVVMHLNKIRSLLIEISKSL